MMIAYICDIEFEAVELYTWSGAGSDSHIGELSNGRSFRNVDRSKFL